MKLNVTVDLSDTPSWGDEGSVQEEILAAVKHALEQEARKAVRTYVAEKRREIEKMVSVQLATLTPTVRIEKVE